VNTEDGLPLLRPPEDLDVLIGRPNLGKRIEMRRRNVRSGDFDGIKRHWILCTEICAEGISFFGNKSLSAG